jgi:hypothetical protein
VTFDFQKWRAWLASAAKDLQNAGLAAECKTNDKNLRSTTLDVSGPGRLGSFRSYECKLVDYEIIDTTNGALIANEAMIKVSDQNFPEVFKRFSDMLRNLN